MTKKEKNRQAFLHKIKRAMVILEYYHLFSTREANAILIGEQTTREEAEAAAKLAQLLVRDREVKPEDFMRDPDDLANKVVELTEEIEALKPKLEEYNLDETTLNQLCRDIEDKGSMPTMTMYAQPVLYYLRKVIEYFEKKSITKHQLFITYKYYISNQPFVPRELNVMSRRLVRESIDNYEKIWNGKILTKTT